MSKYSELTAKRIHDILNDREMTAQDLANASGVSKGSISQYLSGKFTPSSTNAEKIAYVLGTTPEWIMGVEQTDSVGFDDDVLLREMENGYRPKVMKIASIASLLDDYFLDKLLDYATKCHNMQNDL